MNRETRIRKLRMNQYINTNEFIDFALEPSGSVMRFFIGNNSSHNFEINNTNNIMRRETLFTNGLKTNIIDTYDNNDLVFKRNDIQHMLFSSGKVEINQPLHLANELVIDTADKLVIASSLEVDKHIFDIRNLHPIVNNPIIRFLVGDSGGSSIVCEMTNDDIVMSR